MDGEEPSGLLGQDPVIQLSLPLVRGLAFVEISTWDPEFVQQVRNHYTGSRGPPPGRKIAWRIEDTGIPVGWIGLGEPTFKLAARRRLGLEDARPAVGTASCFIYRLLPERSLVASQILKRWHPVAQSAWESRYGSLVHWETMVGQGDVVMGACFRRAGYRSLGWTTGRSARRPPGHTHGPRVWSDSTPKLVLYRGPLHRLPKDLVPTERPGP
jgi:hypothetical protein